MEMLNGYIKQNPTWKKEKTTKEIQEKNEKMDIIKWINCII